MVMIVSRIESTAISVCVARDTKESNAKEVKHIITIGFVCHPILYDK